VLDFLRKGLDEENIDHWHIGYVGNENPITRNLLNLSREDIELAKEVGLTDGDKDYYRNRIILPVWSYGRVVFLTGRSYPVDNEPKYLHLRNTDLLHKELAFKENLRKDHCIITEGILDAIAFIKADFPACALIGTSADEKEETTF
jgi:DNA primase